LRSQSFLRADQTQLDGFYKRQKLSPHEKHANDDNNGYKRTERNSGRLRKLLARSRKNYADHRTRHEMSFMKTNSPMHNPAKTGLAQADTAIATSTSAIPGSSE